MQTKKLALLSTMLIGLGGVAVAQQAGDAAQQPGAQADTVQQQPGAQGDTMQQPGADTDPLRQPGTTAGDATQQPDTTAGTTAGDATQQPGMTAETAEESAIEGEPGATGGFAEGHEGEPTDTLAEEDAEELRTDDTITADTRAPSRSVTTAGEPYTGTVFGAMQADDVIGMRVVDAEGSRAGSVSDLLIGANNEIDRAVIDVGGFLGFGARSVAVDIEDLTVNQEEEEIVLNLTRDQLDAMPEWSEDHEQGLTD
jgi:hypothetical protein